MTLKYFGINSLSSLLTELKNKFATKDIVSTSSPGLVPQPQSSDAQKILYGNCAWGYESVSLSDNNTFEPIDEGGSE